MRLRNIKRYWESSAIPNADQMVMGNKAAKFTAQLRCSSNAIPKSPSC